MRSDIKAWLDEHRTIHAAATEGPWVANEPRELEGVVYPEKGREPVADCGARWNAAAIVDAHNTLPTALSALEAVLGVLEAGVRDGDDAETIATVALAEITEALEGVIDDA